MPVKVACAEPAAADLCRAARPACPERLQYIESCTLIAFLKPRWRHEHLCGAAAQLITRVHLYARLLLSHAWRCLPRFPRSVATGSWRGGPRLIQLFLYYLFRRLRRRSGSRLPRARAVVCHHLTAGPVQAKARQCEQSVTAVCHALRGRRPCIEPRPRQSLLRRLCASAQLLSLAQGLLQPCATVDEPRSAPPTSTGRRLGVRLQFKWVCCQTAPQVVSTHPAPGHQGVERSSLPQTRLVDWGS